MAEDEPFLLADETPFDAAMREAAHDLVDDPLLGGPGVVPFAERMILNGRRRRSPDPRARALQREIDRQALALERRLIYGETASEDR